MKTKEVKRLIQLSAKEEFTLYPDSFSSQNGDTIIACTENISQWAINMWESRTDEEIQRDFELGLHLDNYLA